MGRSKKNKRSKRVQPYSVRQHDDNVLPTDSQNLSSSRGQVTQRHKKEWKVVRKKIEDLKQKRSRLKKKDLKEKAERKEISKQMKQLKEDVKVRHQGELQQWDLQHSQQSDPLMTDTSRMQLEGISLNFSAATQTQSTPQTNLMPMST